MPSTCVTCGKSFEEGDYRLIGVERETWESRYAHRGRCEAEAREKFAPPPKKKRRRKSTPSTPEVEVEELTLEEPEPFPDEELPWFSMGRR